MYERKVVKQDENIVFHKTLRQTSIFKTLLTKHCCLFFACSLPAQANPIWRRRSPPKRTAPLFSLFRAPISCRNGSANRRSWWNRFSRWRVTGGLRSFSSTKSIRCAGRGPRTSRSRPDVSRRNSWYRCKAWEQRTIMCWCWLPPTSPGASIRLFGVGKTWIVALSFFQRSKFPW